MTKPFTIGCDGGHASYRADLPACLYSELILGGASLLEAGLQPLSELGLWGEIEPGRWIGEVEAIDFSRWIDQTSSRFQHFLARIADEQRGTPPEIDLGSEPRSVEHALEGLRPEHERGVELAKERTELRVGHLVQELVDGFEWLRRLRHHVRDAGERVTYRFG